MKLVPALAFVALAVPAPAAAACPQPDLRQGPAGDATSDAAGRGQLFE